MTRARHRLISIAHTTTDRGTPRRAMPLLLGIEGGGTTWKVSQLHADARPNPNQSSSPPQQPPPPRIDPPPDAPLHCLCPSKSKYRWPSRATGRTTSWSRSASTPPRRRRPSGRSRLVWWVCSVGGCCDWSTTTSRCGSIINRLIGAGPVGRSIDWTDEEGSGGCPGSVGRSI